MKTLLTTIGILLMLAALVNARRTGRNPGAGWQPTTWSVEVSASERD